MHREPKTKNDGFLLRYNWSEKALQQHLHSTERKKICQPGVLDHVKIFFKNKREIKTFSDT